MTVRHLPVSGCHVKTLLFFAGVLAVSGLPLPELAAQSHQPPIRPGAHVHEVAEFLQVAEIYAGIDYQALSIFPIRLRSGDLLTDRWLTMDDAVKSGKMVISEKEGGGQVPLVAVQNRSRNEYVLLMAGELLIGGKQTRTIRQDVIVAPGQRVDVPVWCVEKGRWAGRAEFESGRSLLPRSIHRELREGADQQRIWNQVERHNAVLGVPTPTDNLHAALDDATVRQRVQSAHRRIVPEVPVDSTGFVFVVGGRAAGVEFFGHRTLAQRLLPKMIDSYLVDLMVQKPAHQDGESGRRQQAATEFFERIRRASSHYTSTPGSGTGIRMASGGLLGEGVAVDRRLVHFGVQPSTQLVPYRGPR
jgi:hypothetical protein